MLALPARGGETVTGLGDLNVLISSGGRRGALVRIVRSTLSELTLSGRVLVADMSPLSAAWHLADAGFRVPRCTHPSFIPHMLDLCRTQAVTIVIPTIDPELPVYAGSRSDFERAGTMVAVSSPEAIAICRDKRRTHEWLVAHGFPTVRQCAWAELLADRDRWAFPLVVKAREGSASLGVWVVRGAEELAALAMRLEAATHAAAGGPDGYIVQSMARGDEYTVDACVLDGRCVCTVPRRRLETRSGEVSKGIAIRSEEIQEVASRVCEALPGARGVMNVQLFHDHGSGEIAIIELNGRFGGGFPLTWRAGANMLRWLIEWQLGMPSTAAPDEWQDGLLMLRYDDAVFVASGHSLVDR